LTFLCEDAHAHPDAALHLVMTKCAAHEAAEVTALLDVDPRIAFLFTSTHASPIDLVDIWFSIVRGFQEVTDKYDLPGYAVGIGSKGCVTFSSAKIVDYETFKANQLP